MQRDEIRRLLPAIFDRTYFPGSPLDALLGVMEGMHGPAEQAIETLDAHLDPYRAPEAFVPFLARWVALGWLVSDDEAGRTVPVDQAMATGLGRLRDLVARGSELAKWRGTALGLVAFLETVTGLTGFVVDAEPLDPAARRQPFHLRVHAPAAAQPYEQLLRRIVAHERPAFLTYELRFGELP